MSRSCPPPPRLRIHPRSHVPRMQLDCARIVPGNFGYFLVTRPKPIFHFAPFLSTHFFPCLNTIFKNGSFLSVVALVSVTLKVSNPSLPPRKKDPFFHRLPPPPPCGLQQLNFPNVNNDAGQKQHSPCFLRRRRQPKAGDAFTRTRLVPTFGVSAERPAEGPEVGV